MGFYDTPNTQGYTGHSYPNLSTNTPLSPSISEPPGPMLPSSTLPVSAYGGFSEAGREIAAQQRRRYQAQSRRERKTRTRKAAMLLREGNNPRSSQVEDLSGSIDSLTAHSAQAESYRGSSSYHPTTTGRSSYGDTSVPYDAYPGGAYATSSGAYPSYQAHSSPMYERQPSRSESGQHLGEIVLEEPRKPQCWDHGCNGRTFSTFSNLLRHQREKSGASNKSVCHRCGAEFTRKTARDGHLKYDKCKIKGSKN